MEDWHQNSVLNSFHPKCRRHLQGLGVGGVIRRSALQEPDIVGSAADQRRIGERVDGYYSGGDNFLLADVIAEHSVRIVQHGLRDGTGGDETGQILWNSGRALVGRSLAGERDQVRWAIR